MKKIIAMIAALTVSAAMLTACGGSGTPAELQDEVTTTSAAAANAADPDDGSKEDDDAKTDETDAEDGDSTGEASDDAKNDSDETAAGGDSAAVVFASIDELAEADFSAIDFDQTAAADSYTYEFVKTLEGAEGFYLDVESTDGSMAMAMAFDSNKNIAMNVSSSELGGEMNIIITDMTMYMLDPSTMTGMYYAVDESIFDEYNPEEALSQISVDEGVLSDSETIDSCKVQIGGKEYVFEYSNGAGFLYDGGKLCAIISQDDSVELSALIVNEFSGNIPAGIFDIPDGYELVDLMTAFGG